MNKSTNLAKIDNGQAEVEASRAPLQSHLMELRDRLIRVLIAVGLVTVVIFFGISEKMLEFLMVPFHQAKDAYGATKEASGLTAGLDGVVFTAAFEILFIKMKLALIGGLALTFPYVAWEVYGFIAPGLYKSERQAVLPYLFVTPFLFVAGAALVYLMILPFIMKFAFSQEFAGVTFLPKAEPYVNLALSLLTAFGLAFQTPVVLSLLARAGIVNATMLRKGRKYALFIIFVIAMFMTPPDFLSQTALALPVYILYEAGILAVAMIEKRRKAEDEAHEESVGTGAPDA